MGRECKCRGGSLEADILKWKSVGGGTDRDGNPIVKPPQLVSAELVDGICQRYSCLPSQLEKEDVSLLKILEIVALGSKDDK